MTPSCVAATGQAEYADTSVLLLEYNGPVFIQEYSIFDVPTYGSREHNFLEVAPLLHHILKSVFVRNSLNALLNDGSVVEYLGDVMCGRADELDAALVGLQVRPGAHKRGQE